jgi:hypothetical protein
MRLHRLTVRASPPATRDQLVVAGLGRDARLERRGLLFPRAVDMTVGAVDPCMIAGFWSP